MIEITPMNPDGTQHFKANGAVVYSIYTVESLRGTRYAVSPASHIGRQHLCSSLTEAFGLAVDAAEQYV